MKKKNQITVSQDFLEDSIWMSYRYCIGRKTIAASTRAAEIVPYMDYFSKDRKKFFASDIRTQINEQLKFYGNISIEGHTNNYDAYSLLYEYFNENNIEFEKTKFYINVEFGTIKIEPYEKSKNEYLRDPKLDACDIIPWIKLANYLSCDYHTITVKFRNEIKEYECIKTYSTISLEQGWCDVETYLKHPLNNVTINPEYIIEI